MLNLSHRSLKTNGINYHIAEQGEGPLVVLVHGFPESWFSWRHQISAIAKAGYKVIAPDMRGYGETDAPTAIEAYNIIELSNDIVGLITALGYEQAVVIGHDWGAAVAWHTALLHPNKVSAVGALSIPYGGRPSTPPLVKQKEIFKDVFFYMLYFQQPGKAEQELETDIQSTLSKIFYGWSADAPLAGMASIKPRDANLLDSMPVPDTLPDWLSQDELNYYVKRFERSGFRGPLNWYRNLDRNWALTPQLADDNANKIIHQAALFLAGDKDPVMLFSAGSLNRMTDYVPNLKINQRIPNCGHWTQCEQPKIVNQHLIEFLDSLQEH